MNSLASMTVARLMLPYIQVFIAYGKSFFFFFLRGILVILTRLGDKFPIFDQHGYFFLSF